MLTHLIDQTVIPSISADGSAQTQVQWDTLGEPGLHYIHVVVDPQNLIKELNESNNSAFMSLEVAPPSKPDLAIEASDITFSNLSPKEGEPLIINATVHNLGIKTSNVEVFLYDGDPSQGGILLIRRTIPQIVPLGGKVVLDFDVNTVGLVENHNFLISIDPNNRIDEMIESNNIATNSLAISSSEMSLSISTDKAVYLANENVQITLNIKNLINSSRSGTIDVKILGENNNFVAIVKGNQTVSLDPNENKTLNLTWNTGQTLSGSHKVYCQFIEGGNVISKADTPITIAPVKNISSRVNADKISYKANQAVTITSTVTSLSPNYIFSNLNAKTRIVNGQGVNLLTDSKAVPILTPGQLRDLKTYWNTSTSPEGIYTVTLEVLEGVILVSTSSASFEVLGSQDTGEGVKGTITSQPNPVHQGREETVTYTVTNHGNEDISNLTVKALIVNPDTKEVKQTFETAANIAMGITFAGNFILSTSNLTTQTYQTILQVSSATITPPKILASTTFEVMLNQPPVADAGKDQNVITGTPVTLNGSKSYDPEGTLITFLWTFVEVPSGSGVTDASLSDGASAKPTFTPDVDGKYMLRLTLSDGQLKGTDDVAIFAKIPNVAPNAEAGPDQNIFTGTTVYLDGSKSKDPDNVPKPLAYLWSFVTAPAGSGLTDNHIADRDKTTGSFIPDVNGLYVLKLTISDGELSSEDTVQIIATIPNVPPNANAGDDITIYLGERAVLDGSASKDPDSWPQPLSYSWNFVALPNGSQLNRSNISETHAVSPLFTPDVEGTYVLELMVSDGPDAAFDNVAVTAVKPHSLYSKGAYIFIKPKLGVSCSSDLINFPLLIEIANDAQLRHKTYGGWVENINGYDIIFEDANHNQLAHQLEYYDGSTGSLIVWVKIPTLSISTSTVITVEYGNPGISQPTENQIAVWDSHYKAVYHLNQRPRNDGKIYDSTINALDLTPQSSIFDSNRVEAQVGYGLKFRGWDYLISSKNLSLSNRGKFTIETWVKSSSYWGGRQAMVSVQDGNTHGSRTLTSYDDGPMGVQFYYDVPPPTYQIGNPQAHNTWVHLVARYDGTKLEGFMNGVKTSYTSYPGWGPVTGVVTLGVWRGETGWLNWFLTEGYLDEVRISDDARDSCWIETSYNNQRAPFSFYTIGSNPLPR